MEVFRPGQLIVEEGVINIELLQTYSLPQVWLVKMGKEWLILQKVLWRYE